MLNRIKLTNFRRHTSTDMPLQQGLMVLRGNNEAGKSTLIEGVCYALFGVKSIRSSLEDAVTYGEPVSSLKVELDLVIDGVGYSVRRGKSGAEVNYDGGRVTGQNEVTAFLGTKMGVDPASAARLMLANQNEIRGALEAGPKATTELIERLAEFNQIDELITTMQDVLPMGNGTSVEATLADLELRLASAREAAVEPDYLTLTGAVDTARAAHAQAAAACTELDALVDETQRELDRVNAAAALVSAQADKVYDLEMRQTRLAQTLEAARQADSQARTVRAKDEIQADIDAYTSAARHLAAHNRVKGLIGPAKGAQFEGTLPDLRAVIEGLRSDLSATTALVGPANRDLAVLRAGLTAGSCGFCGQDFSNVPAVAEKNAATQARIAELERDLVGFLAREQELKADLQAHQEVADAAAPVLLAIESNPDYLRAEGADIPPTVVWIGPDIEKLQGAAAALLEAQQELRAHDAEMHRRVAAAANLAAAERAVAENATELQQAREALAGLPRWDVLAATNARDTVLVRRRPLSVAASEAQTALRDAEYALSDATRRYEAAAKHAKDLRELLDKTKEQALAMAFNGNLLKRVRQCRPILADKLWTIVLSAVSSYFSEMRGENSLVTKDSDGFKVDGHPVQTLSGSTLDILGLAIRVALVRTFLPNAPFMVLDEPCAAMDATRTEATLGFIVGCGFKQVLLVTHEDTSESVADHLMQL